MAPPMARAPSIAADVANALREVAAAALELLYPFECLVCGATDEPAAIPGLCRECDAAMPRRDPARPPVLAAAGAAFDAHVVALELAPPASGLVYQLKYGGAAAAAIPLAALLEEAVRRSGLERRLDLLTPVPAHWLKAKLRGIDHARALAEELARALRLPLGSALARTRPTVAQGQARSAAERARQVAGAFAARRRRALAGRTIGLVDDVVTSGATAAECARVLKAAGARAVLLLAAAGNG
jgi:predicted amidophosphoribosyltransferase